MKLMPCLPHPSVLCLLFPACGRAEKALLNFLMGQGSGHIGHLSDLPDYVGGGTLHLSEGGVHFTFYAECYCQIYEYMLAAGGEGGLTVCIQMLIVPMRAACTIYILLLLPLCVCAGLCLWVWMHVYGSWWFLILFCHEIWERSSSRLGKHYCDRGLNPQTSWENEAVLSSSLVWLCGNVWIWSRTLLEHAGIVDS